MVLIDKKKSRGVKTHIEGSWFGVIQADSFISLSAASIQLLFCWGPVEAAHFLAATRATKDASSFCQMEPWTLLQEALAQCGTTTHDDLD